jgi:membrane-bound ClpP family serine protease
MKEKPSQGLHLIGKALINNEYYEVHSLGEYVDPQTPIVVIRVEFNRIIVKPKN